MVISNTDLESHLDIAVVVDGPEFAHVDGHAIGEVWTTHDGVKRSRESLTPLDVGDVIADGACVLAEIRGGRMSADRESRILRVHRAACLARRPISGLDRDSTDQLASLVALDEAITEMEVAWRDLVGRRLPNLAKSLASVGLLLVGREPSWEPGRPDRPHPRAREICALTKRTT